MRGKGRAQVQVKSTGGGARGVDRSSRTIGCHGPGAVRDSDGEPGPPDLAREPHLDEAGAVTARAELDSGGARPAAPGGSA